MITAKTFKDCFEKLFRRVIFFSRRLTFLLLALLLYYYFPFSLCITHVLHIFSRNEIFYKSSFPSVFYGFSREKMVFPEFFFKQQGFLYHKTLLHVYLSNFLITDITFLEKEETKERFFFKLYKQFFVDG